MNTQIPIHCVISKYNSQRFFHRIAFILLKVAHHNGGYKLFSDLLQEAYTIKYKESDTQSILLAVPSHNHLSRQKILHLKKKKKSGFQTTRFRNIHQILFFCIKNLHCLSNRFHYIGCMVLHFFCRSMECKTDIYFIQ